MDITCLYVHPLSISVNIHQKSIQFFFSLYEELRSDFNRSAEYAK